MKISKNKQGFTTAILTTVYDRELTLTKPNHYNVLWMNREHCNHSIHLTQEMAGELAKQLAYFARKGKLRTEKQTIENPYINKLLVSTEPHFSRKRYYLGMVESTILSKDIAIQFENRPYQRLRTERIKTLTTRLENIIKWLSEGQQGFYTPNGLVKEL